MKLLSALLLVAAATSGLAQNDAAPAKFYKFDFAVKQMESGQVVSAKTYSLIARAGSRPQDSLAVKTGERIPVVNGAGKNEITYIDAGTNIDCRILGESSSEITMWVSADISSADSRVPPILTQSKWNSNVVAAIGKTTTIFSSDNGVHKGSTQVDVTITPR